MFLLAILMAAAFVYVMRKRRQKLAPFMLERLLKIEGPVPLAGKPDVVWINGKGRLVVGDYKSRRSKRVYPSEIIQLSVYKLLLEKTQARRVEGYGLIYFHDGSSRKIKLLPETAIVSLYQRYIGIITCQIKPGATGAAEYCRFCTHQGKCG